MAHVLIVEPDTQLAAVFRACLEMSGHSVSCCTTAQQGIESADARTPQAVVLELQLTAHSGIEFLYEFRSYDDWRDVPVLVASRVPPRELAASRRLLEQRLGVAKCCYKPRLALPQLAADVASLLAVA
jgi:DNA-binding response OmpR family regulator